MTKTKCDCNCHNGYSDCWCKCPNPNTPLLIEQEEELPEFKVKVQVATDYIYYVHAKDEDAAEEIVSKMGYDECNDEYAYDDEMTSEEY